jgi:hypothetical protein
MHAVTEPLERATVGQFGEQYPLTAAGIIGAASLVGPGKGKPRAVSSGLARELRYNPGDVTPQLPGIEPKTPMQALEAAQNRLTRAQDAASFTDPQTELHFRYQADSTTPYESLRQGQHPQGQEMLSGRGNLGGESFAAGDTVFELDPARVTSMRARGGHEPIARMQENLEAVREAQAARDARILDEAQADALQREALIEELRGQRASTPDVFERADLETRIRDEKRRLPVFDDGVVYRRELDNPGYFQQEGGGARIHESRVPPDSELARNTARLDEQSALNVDAIRERNAVRNFIDDMRGFEPVREVPPWAQELASSPLERSRSTELPAGASWWKRALGIEVDPAAMNRESVAAFLDEVRGNPEAFEFGPMPSESEFRTPTHRSGTGPLEEMADIFGERTGRRIYVEEHTPEESDVPYKIAVKHGRGEAMYDRHGDIKMDEKTHPRGDFPMKDEYGDVKKDPVQIEGREVIDPETLEPLMQKRVAEGGEPVRDRRGDIKYELRKSEGGEVKRDERGRIVEEKNPEYYEQPEDIELSTGGGDRITIHGDLFNEPTVTATSASNTGHGKSTGALLYQTLLADASRRGYNIGASSLTGDNAFRLLSNTLANYARTGVNPRDVANTASGRAPRARGFAEGPELWRAEAEEAKARIARHAGDPTALRFDPEAGFTIHGKPASAGDLKAALKELSPDVGETKVGLKSLQRTAFFDWLRNATPEQAREAAKGIGKKYGPMFGVAGFAIDQGGLQDALREREGR